MIRRARGGIGMTQDAFEGGSHVPKDPSMGRTISMSYNISPEIRRQVHLDMAEKGYNLRSRAQWIRDAINQFLDEEWWKKKGVPGGWRRVVLDLELHQDPKAKKEHTYISEALRTRIAVAAAKVLIYAIEDQEEPFYVEVSMASVIRSAILWRLRREHRID